MSWLRVALSIAVFLAVPAGLRGQDSPEVAGSGPGSTGTSRS